MTDYGFTIEDLQRRERDTGLGYVDQMNSADLSAAVSAGSDTGHVSIAPLPSERMEQTALFAWKDDNVHIWPQLKMLFAIPNGQYRHGQQMEPGLCKGVPDMFLAVKMRNKVGTGSNSYYQNFGGLFIELKRIDHRGTKSGGLRPSQNEWITDLREQGYMVAVCYGAEEAKAVILDYLGVERWNGYL